MSMDFDARQASIKTILTCPICKKLSRKVTIIEECCHRFCKKCITRKIRDEHLRCCPVCNLDLGCAPLQKLSLDNRWQSFRTNFSEKRKGFVEQGLVRGKAKKPEVEVEANEPEVLPSVPCAGRRKKRSFSSFERKPEVSSQTGMTGRRKRGGRKHPPQRASFPSMMLTGKEGDYPESSRAPINSSRVAQSEEQLQSLVAEPFNQEMPYKGKEHRGRPFEGMNHQGVTKSNINWVEPVATSAPSGIYDNEANASSLKRKGCARKMKFRNDEKSRARSDSIRLGKMHRRHQERTLVSEGPSIPAQSIVDATSSKCMERVNPIWFSLVASDKQEGDPPLPQIRPCYLRVKDADVPVSFIKKYLVRKLNLNSENEVEINLHGEPLFSAWRLHDVIEMWLRTMPKSRRTTSVGSSAEDFVMVLSYTRRAQPA